MIYFLVPIYNEEENIERLFADTTECMANAGLNDFRFIFVNDGSSDRSLEILEGFARKDKSVIILSHYPNAGVKTTFLEGFEEFLRVGQSGDLLITKEADNTSDNAILDKMIALLQDGKADVVLASCYAKGGGVESTTLIRRLLSFSANIIIKIRFNMWNLNTFSSFYRGFTYSCLDRAFSSSEEMMTYNGFTCVVEMLVKLKRMHFTIKEVPMILRSSERVGASKMPIFATILGYLRLCLHI